MLVHHVTGSVYKVNRTECDRYWEVTNRYLELYFPFNHKTQTALFKAPVRTALYTLSISVIKTNQFMQ